MPHYKFTHEAERDIENIIDYTLAQWGRTQAEKYIDGLEDLAGNLAKNPELGANRDALINGVMSFPHISHMIYYTRQPHGITILRILHKRMDQGQHLSPKGRA